MEVQDEASERYCVVYMVCVWLYCFTPTFPVLLVVVSGSLNIVQRAGSNCQRRRKGVWGLFQLNIFFLFSSLF